MTAGKDRAMLNMGEYGSDGWNYVTLYLCCHQESRIGQEGRELRIKDLDPICTLHIGARYQQSHPSGRCRAVSSASGIGRVLDGGRRASPSNLVRARVKIIRHSTVRSRPRRTESWYRGRLRGDSVAVKNWLHRPQSDTRRWQ